MGEDDGASDAVTDLATLHRACDLLYREGALLDEQRWDDWLALFVEDCQYWLVAWVGEHQVTRDPATEVSLIYCDRRSALADRVTRVRSGISAAATPLPRTWHMVGAVRLCGQDVSGLSVSAQWQSRAYRFGETRTYYGRYEYRLVEDRGEWHIRSKKIVLINDTIDSVLDFYHL